MNASLIPIIASAILIVLLIMIIGKELKRERRLKLLVRKLYSTELFDELAPILRVIKRQPIEQISVDKRGIKIRLLRNAGSDLGFSFVERGYGFMCRERQEAVRVMLEQCLPKLADRKLYHLTCKRERLINGDVDYIFCYTMKSAYKNKLVRAPYYDGTLSRARGW